MASDSIDASMKERLRAVVATLDPLRLLDEIRTVQHHLAGLASGEPVPCTAASRGGPRRLPEKPGQCLAGRRSPADASSWTSATAPLAHARRSVRCGLAACGHLARTGTARTAKELFDRLREEPSSTFSDGQLRTLQRRVKEWRRLAARRLLFAGASSELKTAV